MEPAAHHTKWGLFSHQKIAPSFQCKTRNQIGGFKCQWYLNISDIYEIHLKPLKQQWAPKLCSWIMHPLVSGGTHFLPKKITFSAFLSGKKIWAKGHPSPDNLSLQLKGQSEFWRFQNSSKSSCIIPRHCNSATYHSFLGKFPTIPILPWSLFGFLVAGRPPSPRILNYNTKNPWFSSSLGQAFGTLFSDVSKISFQPRIMMMIIQMKMTTDDGKCSCARHIGGGGGCGPNYSFAVLVLPTYGPLSTLFQNMNTNWRSSWLNDKTRCPASSLLVSVILSEMIKDGNEKGLESLEYTLTLSKSKTASFLGGNQPFKTAKQFWTVSFLQK